MIEFRRYIPAYLLIAESIFDSNSPWFVHPEEKEDMYKFLTEELSELVYWIMFVDGIGVGMCGYHYDQEKDEGILCWGLLHQDHHGKHLGEKMLLHRIDELKKISPSVKIICRTSQITEGFFARYGFKTLHAEDNYWAPGLHLRTMQLLP